MGQLLSTSTFDASYDILAKLGEGSFGIVYKARNRHTNHVYAVKKVKATNYVTDREKFDTETELLKQAKGHENIVSLIEFFSDRDGFYIVMAFCELGDLNHYVSTASLSVDSKVLLMYDMSSGLDFLHQNNIVHRDMKPANVLVTWSQSHNRPVCKIADFGEAKMRAVAGQLSNMASNPPPSYLASIHGTDHYIAPEVRQCHYTSSCDVFSLGVTFYALLSMSVDCGSNGQPNILEPLVDGQCMYELSFDKIENAVTRLQTLPTELISLTLNMLKTDYHQRVDCRKVKNTLYTYILNPFVGPPSFVGPLPLVGPSVR